MNTATRSLNLMVLLCAAATGMAQQQTSPPPAPPTAKPATGTAQSEAGEPRADTSNSPGSGPASATLATPIAAAPAATPSSGRKPAARAAAGPAGPAAPAGHGTLPAKTDRLDLGTATVTGDREQPKVMYIVPWKRSDIGDLAGKPMNSLVDEILAPVDRDVFKREVVYYRAVQADASQNGAPPRPTQQGEK
jgi:hypothetical protein